MGPKSTHQGVLQEYEKTKHRSDNSILRVMARVKNQNNLVKTATESPVTSSQSDHAQTMMTDVDIAQSLIHKESLPATTWPDVTTSSSSYRAAHSRNSSGASGYSSSNNSSEPKSTVASHQPSTQLSNQALVESLFKDL